MAPRRRPPRWRRSKLEWKGMGWTEVLEGEAFGEREYMNECEKEGGRKERGIREPIKSR